ncbi:MAG: ATP-binding protein [Acidobacteriota bacterium]
MGLPATADSAAVRFDHFTSDDGLSQMNVLDIYQDRLGFMWFETQAGLDRFDGVEFQHTANISGPMWQAPDGGLWVADRGSGLFRIDPQTGEQTRPAAATGLLDSSARNLEGDDGSRVWVFGDAGLRRFDVESRAVEEVYPIDGEPDAVFDVAGSGDGVFFITEDRLLRLRSGEVQELGAAGSLGAHTKLALDADGHLWVGGTGGLDRVDPATGRRRAFRHRVGGANDGLGEGSVAALLADRSGRLWVGLTGGGLQRFEAELDRFVDVEGLASDIAVTSLFQDRSGLLWIGLAPGGFYVGDIDGGKFELFQQTQDPRSLDDNIILALHEDPVGDLWVGTWLAGLSKLDRETGHFEHFRHDPDDPQSLAADRVLAIEVADAGEVWIGLRTDGLDRLDTRTGHFEHFRHDPEDPSSLSSDQTMALTFDRAGRLWIATFGGLNRYRPESDDFERFRHDPDDPQSLSSDRVQHLSMDGDTLWVSTWGGGVNRLDTETGAVDILRHDPDDPSSLAHDVVRSTFVDSAGRLWVATNGFGLDMRPPGAGGFIHFRTGDGLANDVVHGVMEDDLGRLWIPTNGGLSRYDPHLDAWRTFDADDGLQHAEFNFGAFHRGADGRLYAGGIRGFNAFDPLDFPRIAQAPRTVLTRFEGLGHDLELARRPAFLETVRLNYRQNAFSFEAAALDFLRVDGTRYRYRLKPFDEDWIQAGSRRFASYTNLPPGDYELQVRAAGARGVWSPEETLLAIHIEAPAWRSGWAYALYLLTFGGTLFGFIRWQRLEVEREREINRRLREVDRMKDEFLANTSHELRTPLFGITGLAESLIDGVHGPLTPEMNEDLEMISSSGHRLARLVNDLLDFSKLERQNLKIHPRPVDLHTLADVVLTLSGPLVHDDGVELRNGVPADLRMAQADEERLQQILHNLIGNAVKFTAEGHVEISARQDGDEIEVAVTDTGIGIAPEHQERIFRAFEQADASIERAYGGTGLGLAVAQGLVEAHGGRLRLESSTGEGSSFSFRLPVADDSEAKAAEARWKPPILESAVRPVPSQVAESGSDPEDCDDGAARVLIVDDEPVNLRVLSNLLSTAGFRTRTAASGAEALETLEHTAFDLVLLDVMMPKMSGYEVCRELRLKLGVEELPVIFLTAKTQEVDLVAGFEEGGNDYLQKPVTKAELLARVAFHLRLLDAYRRQRAEAEALHAKLQQLSADA